MSTYNSGYTPYTGYGAYGSMYNPMMAGAAYPNYTNNPRLNNVLMAANQITSEIENTYGMSSGFGSNYNSMYPPQPAQMGYDPAALAAAQNTHQSSGVERLAKGATAGGVLTGAGVALAATAGLAGLTFSWPLVLGAAAVGGIIGGLGNWLMGG